jgi:putative transposase
MLGFDGGMRIVGRNRHIAVDTLGLIPSVIVHSACVQDYDGAKSVALSLGERNRRLKIVFADSADGKMGLPLWRHDNCRLKLQTVLRPVQTKGFTLLPKQWIVERTFSWFGRYRRPRKD